MILLVDTGICIFYTTHFLTDVPQTPIHMKPQLARSASKTRGIRAPELGEPKKGEIQSNVMDYLDMTPTRPTQLAPVKVRATCLLFIFVSLPGNKNIDWHVEFMYRQSLNINASFRI